MKGNKNDHKNNLANMRMRKTESSISIKEGTQAIRKVSSLQHTINQESLPGSAPWFHLWIWFTWRFLYRIRNCLGLIEWSQQYHMEERWQECCLAKAHSWRNMQVEFHTTDDAMFDWISKHPVLRWSTRRTFFGALIWKRISSRRVSKWEEKG